MTTATMAVAAVRTELHSNGVDYWEMQRAAAALTDPALSAADSNAVIRDLHQSGDLATFAAELVENAGFYQGGLTVSERQHFLADMAGKLGGAELAMLSDALAATDPRTGGMTYVEELGQAVATHGSPAAKQDYIAALAPQTTDLPTHDVWDGGGITDHFGDPQALAVAHVLGTLRGQAAADGFALLGADQRAAVMTASIEQRNIASNYSGSIAFDVNAARGLLEAAASLPADQADLKADMFAHGTELLRTVRNLSSADGWFGQPSQVNALRDGLTAILESDTTGVMRELTYGEGSFDGSAMGTYAKTMLQTGQEARLGEFMVRLATGNDLSQDPLARFEATVTLPASAGGAPERTRHENAAVMGYFAGSVYAAAASIDDAVQAQQDMIGAVLRSGLSLLGAGRVGGQIGNAVWSVGKDWMWAAMDAAIQSPGDSAVTQMERAALPIENGELAISSLADAAFTAALTRTQRLADL